MDEEKNYNFDINAKYEDMINTSHRIIEHHEFVSDGSCEPPLYICLAYDIKNYLPKLQQENQKLKKQLSNSHQMENQQKEFIEWLEKEIQRQEDYAVSLGLTIDYDIAEYTSGKIDALKESLSKYKEIIGVKDE